MIATGGRPKPLEIPGGEHSISSDDIFYYKKPPGKTLVVGASYVALECAGFLKGIGFDVSIMVRSIFLRGFDQQMAEMAGSYMASHGIRFIRPAVPLSIEKLPSGLLKVTWEQDKQQFSEEFETVLSAIGRSAELKKIGIENAGVQVDPSSGKIATRFERTNVPHIYALGDIIKDAPELTPVAIRAGRLLARRLFGSSTETMDYLNIPTTIFTPLEYGCCGFTEEQANQTFGEENLEVYHSHFKPLEWTVPHREDNACYIKIICLIKEHERVVGVHVLAPNAGEIVQGFAVAMRARATKKDFESAVGIHPTCAEELTTLSITKRSGQPAEKTGC